MRKLIGLAGAAVLVLTGCGGLQGEVVDKQYIPGYYTTEQRAVYRTECHTVTKWRTTYSGTGKYRTSRTTAYPAQDCNSVWSHSVPYQHWHSACARLTVRTDEGKVRSRCVSEQRFYSVEVGQQYRED